MSSPKRTDQASMSSSDQDGESTQDSVKIKDEPVDPSYEKAPGTPNHSNNSNSNSNSNSRSSSPCPPVHFGNMSPSQGRDSASSGPPTPLNDGYSGSSSSSIRTHMQGSNTGKKTDTVQNIVEGLLKKNATLLAMSDAESLRPLRRQKTQDFNNGKKDFSPSAVFPVSSTSQARLVQHEGRKLSQTSKPMLLRPKSPTKKCESVLRDKSQLSYSLMESAVGDETIEKIFKVQQHELVCAVSSKPYIFDKVKNEKKVVASLDNNYFWCNFCSFSSSNKSLITNHLMDHRFSCKFCPYESFCRSDVLRHMGKMHEEFEEMSNNVNYCTFLSDYIRCKTRADGKENNVPTVDQDEDVGDLDKDTMMSYQEENLKRKREREESQEFASSGKWAKMDSPDDNASNGTRQGKSRKSQNPRRHPQVNEKDYDTFEMEVEEIDETENGGESSSERILYPSSSQENSSDLKNPSMGSHMQLIPSLQDEGPHGYTATHVSRPTPPQVRAGRPPTYMGNNRGGNNRGTHRTASASSLYWSCGYCDFQSSSQAEIKEHSNRTHPGKPHRLKGASVYDTGQPPDVIVSNKVKKLEAEDNLPSSHFGVQAVVNDNIVVSEDFVRDEGPHDASFQKFDEKGEKSQEHDDERGSFSKFEALNMLSPSNSEDSTNYQVLETSDMKDNDESVLISDKACLDNGKKAGCASSLKLTFRTIGGATTVSSMTDNDEGIQNESELTNANLTGMECSPVDKSDQFSKRLEEELVDSSIDSESDCSSVCNRENIKTTMSSVNHECKLRSSVTETASCSSKTTMPSFVEKIEDKLLLSCVPARSAAVKAMTKMKPVLDDEVEDKDEETDQFSLNAKAFPKPADIHDKSQTVSLSSKHATYECYYCRGLKPSSLRRVKSHLANQHPVELPVVVNLRVKHSKKKSKFYVCPFSSCNKLFEAYDDLTSHRSTHASVSSVNQSSCSGSLSAVSSFLHVPLEAENIPECRVLLKPLSESEVFGTSQNTRPAQHTQSAKDNGERYECLYCTEHFSHSTLSGMKHHHATEHSGQLLVLRDIEAKKEKQVSRIYVCEESDCEFTSSSRADLDNHSKCHTSNCTFVYECAACGWYSSSFWTAKDHLKQEHSIQDNGYLIHMQLSVDENGHTSKKVLRSI